MLYVGGLVVLFSNFFYQTYLSPKAIEAAKQKKAEKKLKKRKKQK
jgi:hypothetical protein